MTDLSSIVGAKSRSTTLEVTSYINIYIYKFSVLETLQNLSSTSIIGIPSLV